MMSRRILSYCQGNIGCPWYLGMLVRMCSCQHSCKNQLGKSKHISWEGYGHSNQRNCCNFEHTFSCYCRKTNLVDTHPHRYWGYLEKIGRVMLDKSLHIVSLNCLPKGYQYIRCHMSLFLRWQIAQLNSLLHTIVLQHNMKDCLDKIQWYRSKLLGQPLFRTGKSKHSFLMKNMSKQGRLDTLIHIF